MSTFFDACYPQSVYVVPKVSEELHPRLVPYKQQLIIPLIDIIESVDAKLADKWVDKDTWTTDAVLSAVNRALNIWCKNGWRVLMSILDMSPSQANDMVIEYYKSEYRLETPLDIVSLKTAVILIPMLVSVYRDNGYFLDVLKIAQSDNNQPRILGGDLVIDASYIKTY